MWVQISFNLTTLSGILLGVGYNHFVIKSIKEIIAKIESMLGWALFIYDSYSYISLALLY